MEYTEDFDIYTFEFWQGAKYRVQDLNDEQLTKLGEHIELEFDGSTPSATEINDFVWFECDEFLEELTKDDDESEEL